MPADEEKKYNTRSSNRPPIAGLGVQQQRRHKGRPRKQLPAAAYLRYVPHLNKGKLEDVAAYSSEKKVFKSSCSCSAHMRVMSVQQVTRTDAALPCRICEGKGSSYELEAYAACDDSTVITAYAAEAYAVQETVGFEGGELYAGRHSYDIIVLEPGKVIVEVQGEQHSSKLNTQANSADASLANRVSRDNALREAAKAAGFSVVWLNVEAAHTQTDRRQQWRKTIEDAVLYMADKGTARDFTG